MKKIKLDSTTLYNAKKFVVLWHEHTWGAYNSISEPDSKFAIHQWEYKKRLLDSAIYFTHKIEQAIAYKPIQKPSTSANFKTNLSYQIDSITGSIKSILFNGREWIDTNKYSGLGSAIYVKGYNPADFFLSKIKKTEWIKTESNKKTQRITCSLEGMNEVVYEISQIIGDDKLYLSVLLDKKAIREKESVHIALPFLFKQPTVRVGMDDTFISPEKGQLSGSNREFFSVQKWIDISDANAGVSISCPAAALFELGEMIDENRITRDTKTWKESSKSASRLFIYAMNNYWHTNYKADQEGKVRFDITLAFHQKFDLKKAQQLGETMAFPLLYTHTTQAESKTNFDEGWKFHFGHASDPSKDFKYGVATIYSKSGGAFETAIDPAFVDTGWTSLNLPHDWAVQLPFDSSQNLDVESHGFKKVGGLYPETSIGWYRKHFKVAKADSGNRFQLQFDGIFRNATIWVNGVYTGTNLSGYLGVNYDITDFINYEKENVITVRVDASQYEGWFYEGAGIYRHVWLKQLNNLHFANDGVFVSAIVKDRNAIVSVESTIENAGFANSKYVLRTYLTDRVGNKLSSISSQPLNIGTKLQSKIKQSLTLSNPKLWDLDNPYLYRVVSEIVADNKVIDQQTNKFGVRSIRFDANEGFFLNGKHIKIQGTNNHQDHAGIGSALPDAMQYYRIDLLKKMGSNAYRTSHNAPTPELLDACDSLGMLVLDEQRLLNSSNEYIDQFERLIKRDRNHPSVFIWSIGNEEFWIQTSSIGKRIAQTLLAKQLALDPTRTSTYAADLPNYFKGVNEVIPIRGFNYRHVFVADYHRDHPNQPIMGTEMGSTVTTRGIYEKDSISAYLPDQDITAPWWASKAEDWWKPAAENNYWIGGFVWTGFDYRGEPTPYRWPNVNSHFGIMDVCGFPKNIYYYYQSWWTNNDVLHISPHWNWKGKEGKPIDVWVNTNADNVELFLNGKSLGKKEMPRNSHLQWSVNYEPGKLEAIAYKKGKKLMSAVETTGDAAGIRIEPSKTQLKADGKDISVINISVIDKEGRKVPKANQMIKFALVGDAKIIGVGNGDPSSHEADFCSDEKWKRSSFNGKCQVIVQSGKNSSNIQLEANSKGLSMASINLQIQ